MERLAQIFFTIGRHECHVESALQSDRGKLMKKLTEQLRGYDKIDRLYFFNQIEFNECFAKLNMSLKTNSSQNNTRENMEPSLWDYLLCFNLPGRRSFVSKPCHRMDPVYLWVWLFLYICAVIVGPIWLIIKLYFYLKIGLVNESGDWKAKSIYDFFTQQKLLVGTIEGVLLFYLIVMSSIDSGWLFISSLSSHSRIRKLTKMIAYQFEIYQKLVEAFWINVVGNNEDMQNSKANLDRLSQPANRSRKPPYVATKHTIYYSIKPLPSSLICLKPSNRKRSNNHRSNKSPERSLLECAISKYKEQVGKEKLGELNDNLSYIIDLLNVLEHELKDSKEHFMPYLNTNIMFATAFLTLTATIITVAKSIDEILLSSLFALSQWVPLVFALCLGALTERSVSCTR